MIPVAVDLAPGASDGGITFDPVTVYLGEDPISVADLRNSPEFSALAGDLLRTQTVCVANSLPQALTVDDVKVVGHDPGGERERRRCRTRRPPPRHHGHLRHVIPTGYPARRLRRRTGALAGVGP